MSVKKDFSVLFIVQAGKKFGIGHLKRALSIAENYTRSHIWILTDLKDTSIIDQLLVDKSYDISFYRDNLMQSNVLSKFHFDLIVTDCDIVTPSLKQVLTKQPFSIISLDNAKLGSLSEVYIAPLPSKSKKIANFQELYHTPIRSEFFNDFEDKEIKNVLISLGGSDPNCTAVSIIKTLKDTPYNITLIAGPLSKYESDDISGVTVEQHVNDLLPYIKNNDLIICGPGSTLLEAIAAQKYTIVVPHTWKQVFDLKTIPDLCILPRLFLTSKTVQKAIDNAKICRLGIPNDFEFNKWWLNISEYVINRVAFCPMCGSHSKKGLQRSSDQTRFQCSVCDSVYNYDLQLNETDVDPDTIIASNPEQNQISYKVTVLEQKKDSLRRIQIIKKILPTPNYNTIYRLLDIGANQGVFVQEAAHNGYHSQGVELADFARRIAVDNNITMFDSMEKLYVADPIYHVITVWHKLEFLKDPLAYIKRITKYLAQGGLLAIRIPIEEDGYFTKGHFRTSLKGGQLLAQRARLRLVYHTKFIDPNTQKKYIEFYSIKRGSL